MRTNITKLFRMNCRFNFIALFTIISIFKSLGQNPISLADQFNIITEGNLTITQGDIEGAIAVGGNLIVNGNAQRTSANATGGTAFATIGGIKYALVVGGGLTGVNGGNVFKVDGKAGATDDHFIRFNTLSGSTAAANGGGIDIGNPVTNNLNRYVRVNSTTQTAATVVNTTQLVNFSSAFSTFRSQATSISGCTGNVTPTVSGGQATVNLGANTNNVWNVTGATLNSYSQINLTGNLPSATRPLIINVNASGAFNWNNLKFIMGSETDNFMETNRAPYIIWNFYNATSIGIQNANLILGSILAPNADITNNASGNITGQVIAKTFVKPQAGELHIAKFNANVTCASSLPINLISFEGKKVENKTVLNWKTANEKNFSHFEIQRSANAKEFGFIGKVNAANAKYYSFTDLSPAKSINYYRLKMVDTDGSFTYSNIVAVEFKEDSYLAVENPARNGEFVINTDMESPEFELRTILTNKVGAKITKLDKNKYLISVPNYVSGTYFISIISGEKTTTKKILFP